MFHPRYPAAIPRGAPFPRVSVHNDGRGPPDHTSGHTSLAKMDSRINVGQNTPYQGGTGPRSSTRARSRAAAKSARRTPSRPVRRAA